mmetsp:Transcript_18923/g.32304  ORF Transcript_18923/g.32304 Transcript_18923/m.32304 type:complete len:282 (+) Transcript_18923:1539-2384(+)
MFLACCHTIVVDHKTGKYNSASPDELALVNAAKQFGYVFLQMDADENFLIQNEMTSQVSKFKLLNVCEFTSTRKRMSCIFRTEEGKIVLMCKGADSVIEERLSSKSRASEVFSSTSEFVDDFARDGLRTLYLAEKELDEETYQQWNKKSELAKLEINDREAKMAAIDEEIEQDLELIGSTAIEDRLQDDVANTIQFMKDANIKVWVLTGDKVETAINIGVSAGLLDSSMEQFIFEKTEKEEVCTSLSKMVKDVQTYKGKKRALIISGSSLATIDSEIYLRN